MNKYLATILAMAVSASLFHPIPAFAKAIIPEQEIINNEDIIFSIKSFEKMSDDETVLNVYIENNTDQTLTFSTANTFVNGWLCEPYFGCEVMAGMKTNEKIVWSSNILEENHISDFTGIEADLCVLNNETGETMYNNNFTYYPSDEKAFTITEYEPQKTDVVLVDNDTVTVSAISFKPDYEMDECQLLLYVKNKTDKNISVGSRGASIDDFMCEANWVCDLPAEKQAFSKIIWYSAILTEDLIAEAETTMLPLYVVDAETFEELFTETVALNLSDLTDAA